MFDFLLVLLSLALGGGGEPPTATAQVAKPASSALVAEDQTPTGKFLTAGEVKPILNATRGNWVAVREWDGQDLIYVTHIWAWRCGLLQMEVGVNGAAPEIWELPDCHLDTAQPAAILDQDGLPYRAFALSSVETITVKLTYDDLSTDTAEFTRSSVLIP